MKVSEALFDTRDIVSKILSDAGYLDGDTLGSEQIKSATKTIFWWDKIKSKDASGKEFYILCTVADLSPARYGDGKVLVRDVEVSVEIYSRQRRIRTLVESIETAFLSGKWTFGYSRIYYHDALDRFVFEFKSRALLIPNMVGEENGE